MHTGQNNWCPLGDNGSLWPCSLVDAKAFTRQLLEEDIPFASHIVEKYKYIITTFPKDVALRRNYAAYMELNGQMEEARSIHAGILSLDPYHTESLHHLANYWETQGHLDYAIGYYRRIFDMFPKRHDVHRKIEHYYMKKGDFAEALTIAKQARLAIPDDVYYMLCEGKSLVFLERWDDATKVYHTVLEKNPSNYKVGTTLGSLYIQLSKWDDAIGVFEQALTYGADDVMTHYLMGLCYYKSGHMEKAYYSFGWVLDAYPSTEAECQYYDDTQSFMEDIAKGYKAAGKLEKSIGVFNLLNLSYPESYHLDIALIYKLQGRLDLYIKQLRHEIEYTMVNGDVSELVDLRGMLGDAHMDQGEYEQAELCFNTMLGQLGFDATDTHYYQLFRAQISQEKHTEALETIERCIALDPTNQVYVESKALYFPLVAAVASKVQEGHRK